VADTAVTKHTVELTVPVEEVEAATAGVVAGIKKKVKLPGFRPGKAPDSLIRSRFEQEIRQDVLESIIPKTFNAHADREHLKVVGKPGVTEVHLHPGEPLRFTVEFEVFPEFELGEYRGIEAPYAEPVVTEEDVAARIEALRDKKADYVNVDPRPVEDGDHVVVALRSIGGVEGEPIQEDELTLHVGAEDTLPAFTENLRGMTPGEEAEIDVAYPEEYGNTRLAGKTARFHVSLKAIRRKELPEIDDDFAKDVGDFQTLDELGEQLRIDLLRERDLEATQQAKNKLVDTLVEAHDFAVPEAFIDRHIQAELEGQLRQLASQGLDPRNLDLDWREIKKARRDNAIKEVKASLLLDRIAEREAIETLVDEVDREVHRIAKQLRQPAAAVRKHFEEDGTISRIAGRIRTEKVLNFLFENARKVAPEGS
jgi:trigger factor